MQSGTCGKQMSAARGRAPAGAGNASSRVSINNSRGRRIRVAPFEGWGRISLCMRYQRSSQTEGHAPQRTTTVRLRDGTNDRDTASAPQVYPTPCGRATAPSHPWYTVARVQTLATLGEKGIPTHKTKVAERT